jgi:quinol-cytochrome oxidoreductase complex cytochrome b subunit
MNKLISLTTIAIFGLVACAQALLHKTTSKSCPGRKSAPSSVGWNLLFGSILVLFFVPWLDTSRVRSARFRPIYRQFYWLLVVDCMLLKCTRVDDPPKESGS